MWGGWDWPALLGCSVGSFQRLLCSHREASFLAGTYSRLLGTTGPAGRGGEDRTSWAGWGPRLSASPISLPGGPRLPLLSSPPRQQLPWTSPVPGRVQFLEVPPAAVKPKSGSLSYLMVLEARNPTRVSRAHIKVWAELVPPGGSRRESVSWPFPAAGGGARIPRGAAPPPPAKQRRCIPLPCFCGHSALPMLPARFCTRTCDCGGHLHSAGSELVSRSADQQTPLPRAVSGSILTGSRGLDMDVFKGHYPADHAVPYELVVLGQAPPAAVAGTPEPTVLPGWVTWGPSFPLAHGSARS